MGDTMLSRVLDDWLERVPFRRRLLEFLVEQGIVAYLVGGTVRDALLLRESCDIDLAVADGAIALARRLADHLHGAYVPLDEPRGVGRAVVSTESGPQHVDVALLRGPSIEADLWGRDYTVNAMAVSMVPAWGALIDPTGGERDLAASVLRVVSPLAYQDDPLRILRGIRLQASLGFAITPGTEFLMRECLPELVRASGERVRDEILSLLSCDAAAPALSYGQALGAFQIVLPPWITAAALAPGVRAVAVLEEHLPLVVDSASCSAAPVHAPMERSVSSSDTSSDLALILLDFADPLRAHLSVELSSGHPRWWLLKLAAWLGYAAPYLAPPDMAAPMVSARRPAPPPVLLAGEIMGCLRLSAHEEHYLAGALEGASLVGGWAHDLQLGALEAYRYYRRTGEAGVDGVILAMVQRAASTASPRLASTGAHARYLLRAWFEQRTTWVDPPPLVTGYDLMATLGFKPGPELGEWLERVREAQVQGLVSSKDQALSYVRALK